MVTVGGFSAFSTDAQTGSSYVELRDAFVLQTRSEVVDRLRRLAAAVRAGRYPAARPYRHVNGFTKFVVAEYSCGARLTLHYWPAERGATDDVSRPHNHRFPFFSILLGGSQRFVELEESVEPGSDTWFRFRYRPYFGGRYAAVAGRDEVGLRQVRTVDRAPLRGYYETSSSVVHQAVTSRTSACATLVLRGPRERRTSHVYYRPAEPPPRGGIQLGRRLAHDEVVEQLHRVLSLVTSA
jgi:hypothetical protein